MDTILARAFNNNGFLDLGNMEQRALPPDTSICDIEPIESSYHDDNIVSYATRSTRDLPTDSYNNSIIVPLDSGNPQQETNFNAGTRSEGHRPGYYSNHAPIGNTINIYPRYQYALFGIDTVNLNIKDLFGFALVSSVWSRLRQLIAYFRS